jgi:site-specific recombinase XerD
VPTLDGLKEYLQESVLHRHSNIHRTKLSFFDVYNKYLEVKAAQVQEATIKKFKTLKRLLKDFQQEHGYTLTFDAMNHRFQDEFKLYLFTMPNPRSKHGYGLLDDSIDKHISCLRSFLEWANTRGYTEADWRIFKHHKLNKHDIVVLEDDEIQRIRDVDLSTKPMLDRVRDVFVFLLFTAQRWGDYDNFEPSALDPKKRTWEFIAEKTRKDTTVPMVGYLSPAWEILEKYDFNPPKFSLQFFNRHIKDVARIARIDDLVRMKRWSGKREIVIEQPKHELISAHTARRTCVTRLLSRGMPSAVLMKLTGHSSLATLQKYENVSQAVLNTTLKNIR